jgi:CubicO group peptidase (beta-lactamase class C family)
VDLPGTMSVAERYLAQGACRSVEVAVADRTGLLGGFRLGRNRHSGFPLWTCAGKGLLAICVAYLVGRRELSFADRIVTYLPELDTGETGLWRDIRLGDLLSHSVALHHDLGAWAVFREDDEVLWRLRSAVPAEPGSGGLYLRWTNFFLIGQVITRVAGQRWDGYVRRTVLDPLGLRDTRLRYPMAMMAELSQSVRSQARLDGEGRFPVTARQDRCWPGMSASGPMSDLARVLAVLLPDAELLAIPPPVVAEVTTVRNRNTAAIEGNPLNWGLGVMVDRRIAGPRFDAGTFGYFGHGGTVVGFADPARGLSIAVFLGGLRGGILSLPLRRSAIIHSILDDASSARAVAGTASPPERSYGAG